MSKKEFLEFVLKYRSAKSIQFHAQTIDVLGLGPVDVYFDKSARVQRFTLKNEGNRPVVLRDLK
jgi:hypothetical protein